MKRTLKSFYRRIYIAYLIESGSNTVPLLMEETGMSRRTIQDAIRGLADLSVVCKHAGPKKTGKYGINDWGPISKKWVKDNIKHVKSVLQ